MWRAMGMMNELRVEKGEGGLFYPVRYLARMGEEPHRYPVRDPQGRVICFKQKKGATAFCELAAEIGIEDAIARAVQHGKWLEVPGEQRDKQAQHKPEEGPVEPTT